MQPGEYFQNSANKQNQRLLNEECPKVEIIKGENLSSLVSTPFENHLAPDTPDTQVK